MKKLCLLLGLLIILSTVVAADKISIEDVKFFINDKETSVNSDNELSIDPDDELGVRVYYQSNFTNSTSDPKIEDVIIDLKVDKIDDKDDLRDSTEKTTLSPNEKEDDYLEIDIPLEVQEDEYDLIIEVEGEDENGTSHSDKIEYRLIVDKPQHKIDFFESNFTEYNLTNCNKETILKIGLINIGEQDEDVKLEIVSEEIGLNYVVQFELEAGAYDGTHRYEENLKITIPENTLPGRFSLDILANYDNKLAAKSKYIYYNCDKVETKNITTVETKPVVENKTVEKKEETKTENKTVTTTATEKPKDYNKTLSVTKRTNETILHDFTLNEDYTLYFLIAGFIILLLIIVVLLIVLLK